MSALAENQGGREHDQPVDLLAYGLLEGPIDIVLMLDWERLQHNAWGPRSHFGSAKLN